jgi:hypothetical protein
MMGFSKLKTTLKNLLKIKKLHGTNKSSPSGEKHMRLKNDFIVSSWNILMFGCGAGYFQDTYESEVFNQKFDTNLLPRRFLYLSPFPCYFLCSIEFCLRYECTCCYSRKIF